MTSSLSITLIALGIIAALAFFTAAGFRGSGKSLTMHQTCQNTEMMMI